MFHEMGVFWKKFWEISKKKQAPFGAAPFGAAIFLDILLKETKRPLISQWENQVLLLLDPFRDKLTESFHMKTTVFQVHVTFVLLWDQKRHEKHNICALPIRQNKYLFK